jgi:uncharacterized protein
MTVHIADIIRYPVKGLSPEHLETTQLAVGQGLLNDRGFALAPSSSRFDSENPSWCAKGEFLTLLKDEKLALLDAAFDGDSAVLTIRRDGKSVARGDLSTLMGRVLIEQFFAAFMPPGPRGNPKIVDAPDTMFSDTETPFVSIINLASVRDIERVARCPVNPLRFRGNLHIDGASPWIENDWIGRTVTIGGATLKIMETTGRCGATSVDPDTAERDLNILRILQQGFGHTITGVYAEVVEDGPIQINDVLELA